MTKEPCVEESLARNLWQIINDFHTLVDGVVNGRALNTVLPQIITPLFQNNVISNRNNILLGKYATHHFVSNPHLAQCTCMRWRSTNVVGRITKHANENLTHLLLLQSIKLVLLLKLLTEKTILNGKNVITAASIHQIMGWPIFGTRIGLSLSQEIQCIVMINPTDWRLVLLPVVLTSLLLKIQLPGWWWWLSGYLPMLLQ